MTHTPFLQNTHTHRSVCDTSAATSAPTQQPDNRGIPQEYANIHAQEFIIVDTHTHLLLCFSKIYNLDSQKLMFAYTIFGISIHSYLTLLAQNLMIFSCNGAPLSRLHFLLSKLPRVDPLAYSIRLIGLYRAAESACLTVSYACK